jgi:hypothetical protein
MHLVYVLHILARHSTGRKQYPFVAVVAYASLLAAVLAMRLPPTGNR